MTGLLAAIKNTLTLAVGGLVVIGGLVLVIISKKINHQLQRLSSRQCHYLISITWLAVLTCQLIILWKLPVTVYHDPFRILYQAAPLSHGIFNWGQTTYFLRYPNNVPLTVMLAGWLAAMRFLGISSVNFAVGLLQVLLLNLFLALTLSIGWQLSHRRSVIFGILSLYALTPFAYTYYLQVFYSDLINMVLLLAIFSLLIHWPAFSRHQRWLAAPLIIILSMFAQLTKGNFIVLIPAVLITLVHYRHAQDHHLRLPLLLIIVGIFLSFPAAGQIKQAAHFHPSSRYQLPVTSWVAMGLNPHTRGTYSSHDIQQMVDCNRLSQRKQVARREIKQRLRHDHLIHQFTSKIGILLNGGNIANWYNGGLRNAPRQVQRVLPVGLTLALISYQLALCTLFWLAIIRLWWPSHGQVTSPVVTLAIVTAIGFLSFHALLWESEERYGQILVPLLLIIIAATPPHNPLDDGLLQKKWPLAILTILVLLGCGAAQKLPAGASTNSLVNATVVAAQRSEPSSQYNAKPTMLASRQQIKQTIVLNHQAGYLMVHSMSRATLQGTLTNLKTGKTKPLRRGSGKLMFRGHLAAGKYQVRLSNPTAKPQPVIITHVIGYRLAAGTLQIGHRRLADSSLVYLASRLKNR